MFDTKLSCKDYFDWCLDENLETVIIPLDILRFSSKKIFMIHIFPPIIQIPS